METVRIVPVRRHARNVTTAERMVIFHQNVGRNFHILRPAKKTDSEKEPALVANEEEDSTVVCFMAKVREVQRAKIIWKVVHRFRL